MVQIVWLKRDLRIQDHAPLTEAAKRGPCLVLFVYEREWLEAPEFDPSHLQFVNDCLEELDQRLSGLGARLTYRVGGMPEVLDEIRQRVAVEAIWSHEETGCDWTFRRDRRVARWAKQHAIPWHELPQTGVVRRLKDRDGWARTWFLRMSQPIISPPQRLRSIPEIEPGKRITATELGVGPNEKRAAQRGGESLARETLSSFLQVRGLNYRSDMSSPVTGWDGCSRLSPHLAWGSISIKQVHQATEARRAELRECRELKSTVDPNWARSLSSFAGRLHWHCHFMQKLEDEPGLEFVNMSRAYDGLREDSFDETRFAAWCEGQTGYPLVDACLRCLRQTGWINFRMRAMLASFASYHLWLHWRPTAVHLAKHFLDFEPGIHYSQFQMQSGVTGINTVRIYSPIKQVKDQDPTGEFIRRWVPELEGIPTEQLAEPHKIPPLLQQAYGCVIGRDYPPPIVDHGTAYRLAKERIFAVRRRPEAKLEAEQVYRKHGSRRRSSRRGTRPGGIDRSSNDRN